MEMLLISFEFRLDSIVVALFVHGWIFVKEPFYFVLSLVKAETNIMKNNSWHPSIRDRVHRNENFVEIDSVLIKYFFSKYQKNFFLTSFYATF